MVDAPYPTMHSMAPNTKNYLAQMSTVERLRNSFLDKNFSNINVCLNHLRILFKFRTEAVDEVQKSCNCNGFPVDTDAISPGLWTTL